MRALTKRDRDRVFATMQAWANTGSKVALRTRALITLAADTGLRVQELVRLDLGQVLADPDADAVRIAAKFYLRRDQAKRGDKGAGNIHVSERARTALRAWIRAARAAQWMQWPAKRGAPLFVGHRGYRGKPGHGRLSVRAAQWSWHDVQARARIVERYNFHSLRHDAASRLRAAGGDVFDLAAQLRWRKLEHAQRYVHEIDSAARLPAIQKRAAKL